MKKLVIVLALATALVACGKKNKDKAKDKPAPTAAQPAQPTPPAAPPATPPAPPAPPATNPSAATGTGVAECDEFLATIEKALACEKLAPNKDALVQNRDNQKKIFASWAALDEAARKAAMGTAATQCKGGSDALKSTMAASGC